MPRWLKALTGIVVAIPVSAFAFVWYLENAFESGGCVTTTVGQGVVRGDIGYKITRLHCDRVDDEFMVVVGPPNGMIAAIATVKLKPVLIRAEGPSRAVFSVDGSDLDVTLDGLGQPVERIDVEADGRRSATPRSR